MDRGQVLLDFDTKFRSPLPVVGEKKPPRKYLSTFCPLSIGCGDGVPQTPVLFLVPRHGSVARLGYYTNDGLPRFT